MNKILVTGGFGYIGSHFVIKLIENNYIPVIIDNSKEFQLVINNIKKITNVSNIIYYNVDMCDINNIDKIFKENIIYGVVHFASLKSIPESINNPTLYYYNNINSTTNLLLTMEKYKCNNLIFSSSACIYENQLPPFTENMTKDIKLTNPYGFTKKIIEDILKDNTKYNKNLKIICLRYFNPVGAHKSGLIGENIITSKYNLLPNILRTLIGKQDNLYIYGTQYNTPDGSCIRDYIHIDDLIEGHMICLYSFNKGSQYKIYNLGSGIGYSVFELVDNISLCYGSYPKIIKDNNRIGDFAINISDISKIKNELGWEPKKTLNDICIDSINYLRKSYINNI